MKTLVFVGLLGVVGWFVYGCSTQSQPVEEAQTYQCPACKETVQYQYYPNKPWIRTGKVVVHTCDSCKRTWAANLGTGSTCAECNRQHLECPVCRRHGG